MTDKNRPIRVLGPNGEYISNCTVRRKKQLLQRSCAIDIGPNTIQLTITKEDRRRFRKEVLVRDSYICYICKLSLRPGDATVDHILSRSKGGTDLPDNLACCCKTCNSDKGDMDLEDFLAFREIRQALSL